jgi:FMN phosphatase YigB (HAD superfamily)
MKKIKNIIFDYGGVIINLDMEAPLELMKLHTRLNVFEVWQEMQSKKVFEMYEQGLLSDQEFRNAIRNFSQTQIDDDLIDQIWNSLLLDMPKERIDLLKKCKNNYRTFLLSNSNAIHYKSYFAQLNNRYKLNSFDDLFEKAYFSFEMYQLKPSPEIFQTLIDNHQLIPEETLFIDDTIVHIETAKKLGIQTVHLTKGLKITDIFDEAGRVSL